MVLPGVGAFADCRAGLDGVDGLTEALTHAVISRAVPFLGICVGMQLMADVGREHGIDTKGLGWIPGEVVEIRPDNPSLKIPHMGWNALKLLDNHAVLDGISDGDHAYFVHSYQLVTREADHRIAEVDHGGPVTAAVGRNNLFGTQFHPEKSQETGLLLIRNFLNWAP